jgi:hypothetical protein
VANKNGLTINRGTNYDITLNYKENGSAASIAGATVYFTTKSVESDSFLNDSSEKIMKTVTNHQDAPNGISLISLSAIDTYIPAGSYFYDVRIKLANGKSYKLVEGKLKIDGSPTNRNVS